MRAQASFDGDRIRLFRRAELVGIALAGRALLVDCPGCRGIERGEADKGRKEENQLAHGTALCCWRWIAAVQERRRQSDKCRGSSRYQERRGARAPLVDNR